MRCAFGRGKPEGESGDALGRHAGVGVAGSVVSRAAREGEGARGVGRQMAGGGFEDEVEENVVRLRIRIKTWI